MKIHVNERPSTDIINVGVLDIDGNCVHMDIDCQEEDHYYQTDMGLECNTYSTCYCLYCRETIEPEEDYDD